MHRNPYFGRPSSPGRRTSPTRTDDGGISNRRSSTTRMDGRHTSNRRGTSPARTRRDGHRNSSRTHYSRSRSPPPRSPEPSTAAPEATRKRKQSPDLREELNLKRQRAKDERKQSRREERHQKGNSSSKQQLASELQEDPDRQNQLLQHEVETLHADFQEKEVMIDLHETVQRQHKIIHSLGAKVRELQEDNQELQEDNQGLQYELKEKTIRVHQQASAMAQAEHLGRQAEGATIKQRQVYEDRLWESSQRAAKAADLARDHAQQRVIATQFAKDAEKRATTEQQLRQRSEAEAERLRRLLQQLQQRRAKKPTFFQTLRRAYQPFLEDKPGDEQRTLSRIGSISLQKRHFKALLEQGKEKGHLDDETIAAYLQLLADTANQQKKKVRTFSSFLLKKLAEKAGKTSARAERTTRRRDIFEAPLWLIPVHRPHPDPKAKGGHWMLAAVTREDNKFSLYLHDSMGGSNRGILPLLQTFITEEWAAWDTTGRHPNFSLQDSAPTPQQENTDDCGLFLLEVARTYALGEEPDFGQEDISEIRQRIAVELLQKKIE